MTTLINKISKHCLRPLPDRLFTWIEINNTGTFSLGAATYKAGFCVNYPFFPLNNSGGIAQTLTNPLQANAGINPCSLKNLMFNAATNSGFYVYGRSWRTEIELYVQPEAIGDQCRVSMAPVLGATNSYGSVFTAAQGPFGKTLVCSSGSNAKDSRLFASYDIAKIYGIPKALYPAIVQPGTGPVFSSTTAPAQQIFANIWVATSDAAVTTNAIAWDVKIKFLIEFFGATDTQLIDN